MISQFIKTSKNSETLESTEKRIELKTYNIHLILENNFFEQMIIFFIHDIRLIHLNNI